MLTDVEKKVIQSSADGKAYKMIADDLCTTTQVIKNVAFRLFKEFGAENKTHLVAVCLRRGLID